MSQSSTSATPQSPAPPLKLATEFLKAGRPAEAIKPLREAALLQPSNAAIEHDLGLACLEAGELTEAVEALQRAVVIDPAYADAYFRLGIALEKQGDWRAATAAYHRATALLPSFTEAWYRAGSLIYDLGHREEAVGCFRRAAVAAKSRFGRLSKARVLLIDNRRLEAEHTLRRTVESDPESAMAHDLLGNLLSEQGRFDEARGFFARAIEITPLLAGSYYELVRCRRVTSADEGLIERMQVSLSAPGLEPPQRQRIHLAIGKAAEDLGDYELAMHHFDAADMERRSFVTFDSAAFSAEVDRLISRCTPQSIARAHQLDVDDETPILIIGMPRSGTTLMEQMISMHPAVGAGGELNFWNERGAAWHASGEQGATFSFLANAVMDYLGLLRPIAPKAARVTDKMPFNFLWAGLIHMAFPRAVFIHCRRAPVDTALSIHQTFFHAGLAFPTGGEELVSYFRDYQRLMDHWRGLIPPDRFIEVDYEELTRAPEPEIRRVLTACGLPWNEACLYPEHNPRSVDTPSKWQVRQPIFLHSVARWRRYEPWLGPLWALVGDGATTGTTSYRNR